MGERENESLSENYQKFLFLRFLGSRPMSVMSLKRANVFIGKRRAIKKLFLRHVLFFVVKICLRKVIFHILEINLNMRVSSFIIPIHNSNPENPEFDFHV